MNKFYISSLKEDDDLDFSFQYDSPEEAIQSCLDAAKDVGDDYITRDKIEVYEVVVNEVTNVSK